MSHGCEHGVAPGTTYARLHCGKRRAASELKAELVWLVMQAKTHCQGTTPSRVWMLRRRANKRTQS
eukprot:4063334-Amphidinium_carterae.2